MSHWVFPSFLLLLATSVCTDDPPAYVVDKWDDKRMLNLCTNINYQEYCGKIGSCEQGTHIMCRYYRTGQIMGPNCEGGRMIKMPEETKEHVMELLNQMRAAVSNGTMTAKDSELLPTPKTRLVELQWDKDLALFAQVWANQCDLLTEDSCRATKDFPSPGQAVTLATFYYTPPEGKTARFEDDSQKAVVSPTRRFYLPFRRIGKSENSVESVFILTGVYTRSEEKESPFDPSCLFAVASHRNVKDFGTNYHDATIEQQVSKRCIAHETLKEAIDTGIKNWYSDKDYVTSKMIKKYKGVEKINGEYRQNNFLTIIYEKSTHVGCGMSTYNSYLWNESEKNHMTVAFELVCNLSAQPVAGKSIYKTGLENEEESNETTSFTTDDYIETTEMTTDRTTLYTEVATTENISEQPTYSSIESKEYTSGHPTDVTAATESTADYTTSVSTHKPDDTTTDPHSDSSDERTYPQGYEYSNATGRRVPVLILPIVTVDDAPSEKYMQKLSLINKKLRDYSKKVLSNRNRLPKFNKEGNHKPKGPKKGSIFTRVPKFHLPSQNYVNINNENSQEDIALRNKLKALMKQVPRKDISRLEDALKLLQKTRSRRLNQLSTASPLLKLKIINEVNVSNPVIPKIQNLHLKRPKHDIAGKIMDETDIELLNVIKGVLKEHGKETRFVYGDTANNSANKFWSKHSRVAENSIGNVENVNNRNPNIVLGKTIDGQRGEGVHSLIDLPVIRKQIPIVYAKENNVFNENDGKIQMKAYSDLKKSGKLLNNHIKNSNFVEQPTKFVEGSNISQDDTKLKRRMYLENEINKLKRKLQHLRQYIRQNDISENNRYRPVVDTLKKRRNIRLKDAENFYMPDRAHSIHDF